jgi:hypothetical protein
MLHDCPPENKGGRYKSGLDRANLIHNCGSFREESEI